MAIENYPASHNARLPDFSGKKMKAIKNSSGVYACNLRNQSQQCREYEILVGAKTTLLDIKEGCESMGGDFSEARCPTDNMLGECSDIIRNYHQPDVIYLNRYYKTPTQIWTTDSITRVCGDLGGEFNVVNDLHSPSIKQ